MREYLLGLITTPAVAAVLVWLVWLDPRLERCGFGDGRLVYFGGLRKHLFGARVHFWLRHRDYTRAWTRLVKEEGTGARALRRMRKECPDLLPEHMRRRPVPTLRADWPRPDIDPTESEDLRA